MIYLISEETTVYTNGVNVKSKVLGYHECNTIDEVKEFCNNKTKELQGTYDSNKMDKTIIYEKLEKIK